MDKTKNGGSLSQRHELYMATKGNYLVYKTKARSDSRLNDAVGQALPKVPFSTGGNLPSSTLPLS